MRRRASDDAADGAIVHLLRDGLVDSRSSAYLRRPESHVRAQADEYHEHIEMIADICHTLPEAFLPGGWGSRQTLQYVWSTNGPLRRTWIDETLERHDISIGDVLGFEL
jgi:hypothetical protein